jgi:hypothetical protein
VISTRVTAEEHALVKAEAEAAGRSLADYVRHALDSAEVAPAARTQVPELNQLAWARLAPLASNLNQLARESHNFRRWASAESLGPELARQLISLFGGLGVELEQLRGRVEQLRRSVVAKAPLELAALKLDAWASAARTGRLGVERERIEAAAAELRQLAQLLEGEPL